MFAAATKSAFTVPPSVSYITSATDSVGRTTYNFTSTSFGSASDRSLVIVGVSGYDGKSESISSVSVGGVAATQIVQSTSATAMSGIFAAVVSGTSGTVSVTFGSAVTAAAIGVWAAYNLSSTTAFNTNSNLLTSGTSISANVNTPSQGVVIAVGTIAAGANRTFTWTGVTERYDTSFSSTRTTSGGDFTTTSAESPRTVSYISSGSISYMAISAASWQ
jgi:hypothetical protein